MRVDQASRTLRQEAQTTSALEGTHASLTEVLEADYVEANKQTAEVREVMNYVRTAEQGLELIKVKPICLTVIAELQKILVHGTRGDSYDSGQLRQRQVFIGDEAGGLENVRFVPRPPGAELVEGVSDWEKWLNAEDDLTVVVKAALAITSSRRCIRSATATAAWAGSLSFSQLVQDDVLTYPVINLSQWFEPRKERYKDLLRGVSETGQYDAWVQFFCEAVVTQSNEMVDRIEKLLDLRVEMLGMLRAHKVRGVAVDIVEDLIGFPIITPPEAAQRHSVTFPPASAAMKRLESLGILREITGASYGRIYLCERVLQTLDPQPLEL